MKTRSDKLVVALNCVALLISALTLVPYNLKSVLLAEALLKFLAYPLLIVLLSVYPLILRFRKLKHNNAEEVIRATVPSLTYLASACFYLAFLSVRNHELGSASAFGEASWIISLVVYLLCGLFLCFFNLLVRYSKKQDASKNAAIAKNIFLALTMICVMTLGLVKTVRCSKIAGGFTAFKGPVLAMSIITALAVVTLSLLSDFVFFKNRGLKVKAQIEYARIYNKIEDDRLFALLRYAEAKLSDKGYVLKHRVVEKAPVEAIKQHEEKAALADDKHQGFDFFKSFFKKKANKTAPEKKIEANLSAKGEKLDVISNEDPDN